MAQETCRACTDWALSLSRSVMQAIFGSPCRVNTDRVLIYSWFVTQNFLEIPKNKESFKFAQIVC